MGDQLPLDWWKQFPTEIDAQVNANLSRSAENGPTLPLWTQPHPAPWARGKEDVDRSWRGANAGDGSPTGIRDATPTRVGGRFSARGAGNGADAGDATPISYAPSTRNARPF